MYFFTWLNSSIRWQLILPVPFVVFILTFFVWIYLPPYLQDKTEENAVAYAKQLVNHYKLLREYYTRNVIAKALDDGSLTPTFRHKMEEKGIPLPATMIHDMSDLLRGEETSLYLYSAYPFPNRQDRKLDEFQQTAWDMLNSGEAEEYTRLTKKNGHTVVRVAIPDLMVDNTCVDCHNTHPLTPRIGWKLGDIRGILEADVVVDDQIATQSLVTRNLLIGMMLAGALLVACVYYSAISVIKPILHLTKVMKHLAEKDYHYKNQAGETQRDDEKIIIPDYGKDEIGTLGRTFDNLITNLHASRISLSELACSLEDQVEERTSTLKERERELEQALIKAQAADRAKSEFLSSMSHELRTPLNNILGFGQLLTQSRKSSLTEKQAGYTQNILKSGRHLLNLINEILDLSKIGSGKIELSMEDLDINILFMDCADLVSSLAEEKNVRLNITYVPKGFPSLYVDHTRAKQIIVNLLTNAIKYNRKNGRVILLAEIANGNTVRIIVRDTGIGIPKEKHQLIFKPFNRLGADKSNIEGTGIGLVIVSKLVALLKGKVYFESEEGIGSIFNLELPSGKVLSSGKIPEKINMNAPISDLDVSGNITLLYIEDNPSNLELMKEVIGEIEEIDFIAAITGELGLTAARTHRPDIILLDINLPKMSGFEVFEQLKAWDETKNIPVIALSANAMPREIKKALSLGFDSYLTKPIDIKKTLAEIYHLLSPMSKI